MSKVAVYVPTRDGKTDHEVLGRIASACEAANRVEVLCSTAFCKNPYSVAAARNQGVVDFLKSNATHLFFVDDDVLLPPNAIVDLLLCDSDVAGGCVPSLKYRADGKAEFYVQVQRPLGEWWRTWLPRGPREAEAVGGGCMMVKRGVVEALPFPWFRWVEQLNQAGALVVTSDDTDFCGAAKMAGLTVRAHGGVRCGHRKTLDVAQLIPEK